MTNLQAFIVIAPNHSGDDLYRFDEAGKNKAEYYARQILGTVNYRVGGNLNNFFYGWVNYQIEHHLVPEMTFRQCQEVQPRVKALCAQYGLPYKQESVFKRVRKLVDIMVGNTSMVRVGSVVPRAEPAQSGVIESQSDLAPLAQAN